MSMDCHRQDLIFFKMATFPGLRLTKTVWLWLMDFQQSDDFMGLGKNSEKLHRLKTHHHAKSGRFSVSIHAIDDLFA